MPTRNSRAVVFLACILLPLLAVAFSGGCVGYTLGTSLPKGITSIYIPTFVNKCEKPQVEIEATRAAIEEFQKDGTLEITSEEYAKSVVEVTLLKYKLETIRFNQDQNKTAMEYRQSITASIVFRRQRTDETLSKRTVTGESTFIVSGDLPTQERLALPATCKNLAHYIVSGVVEYW